MEEVSRRKIAGVLLYSADRQTRPFVLEFYRNDLATPQVQRPVDFDLLRIKR